jgi:hypothetical protein
LALGGVVIVKLDLDPKLVWRLEESAERAGLSVSQMLAQAFQPKVSAVSVAAERTRSEVIRLHSEGLADEEIAVRVDRVKEHVARLRRAAGLKPNRRKVA